MRISVFIILFLNLFLIGCVTNQTPVEDNYFGSKTDFEDVAFIDGFTIESSKYLLLGLLDESNFIIVLNDSNQNVLVAKKQIGMTNTFITTSIYLFEESNGVKIRIKSNVPKDYSSGYKFHSNLLKSLSLN